MLNALKYCLLLTTVVSVMAQQSVEITTPINPPEIILDVNLNSEQAQDLENHDKLIELGKELLIDATQIEGLEVVIFSIATIIHELGHAVSAKSLFDVHDPIQIHIGTYTAEEATPRLFSLGNMHFYKTIPWIRGRTEWEAYVKQERNSYLKTNLAIEAAAGGISAAALMYFLLSAITWYCAYCDNKKLSEITLKSLINGASPFTYILNTKNLSYKQKRFLINATLVICLSLISNIFYGCTPYRGGDGVKIWKEYMGVTGTPLKIVHVLSTLGAWGCWILLIKKYCDARKKLSPELSKISIPVALSSFLLMCNQLIPSM
jgi:hypothetical protein